MLHLPARSVRSTFQRSSVIARSAKMSTAYILPIDPKAPKSQSALHNLDAAKLWSTIPASKKTPKVGTTRVFYNSPPGCLTALVSLGEDLGGKKGDARREVIRKAVGSAVKEVKGLVESETAVSIDASEDPHAAGKSCYLLST